MSILFLLFFGLFVLVTHAHYHWGLYPWGIEHTTPDNARPTTLFFLVGHGQQLDHCTNALLAFFGFKGHVNSMLARPGQSGPGIFWLDWTQRGLQFGGPKPYFDYS